MKLIDDPERWEQFLEAHYPDTDCHKCSCGFDAWTVDVMEHFRLALLSAESDDRIR